MQYFEKVKTGQSQHKLFCLFVFKITIMVIMIKEISDGEKNTVYNLTSFNAVLVYLIWE